MKSLITATMLATITVMWGCAQLTPTEETIQPVKVVDAIQVPYEVSDTDGKSLPVRMLSSGPQQPVTEKSPAAAPVADQSAEAASPRELRAVYFGLDQSDLTAQAKRELEQVVAWLRDSTDRKITVEAFSDKSGTAEYNLRLSESRAESVKTYLTGKGVDASRITLVGKGEDPGVERKAVVITH